MDIVDHIELTLPAKAEYIGVARLTISGIANRMGYSYDDIEDIKIAVSEAITNSVNHAYRNQEKGNVSLVFDIFDEKIDIFVSDTGKSFDYESILKQLEPVDSGKAIEQMNEGGLGLFLIETLMDDVTISGQSGIVVKMTKFLKGNEVLRDDNKISSTIDK